MKEKGGFEACKDPAGGRPATRQDSLAQCLQDAEVGGVGTPADLESFAAAENADDVGDAATASATINTLTQMATADAGCYFCYSGSVNNAPPPPPDAYGGHGGVYASNSHFGGESFGRRRMQLKEQTARETQCRRDDCNRRHGTGTTETVGSLQQAITADVGCFFCSSGSVDNSNSNRHDSNPYEAHVHGHVGGGRRALGTAEEEFDECMANAKAPPENFCEEARPTHCISTPADYDRFIATWKSQELKTRLLSLVSLLLIAGLCGYYRHKLHARDEPGADGRPHCRGLRAAVCAEEKEEKEESREPQ
eukprot:SAG22_NODE_1340_length_4691_cov_566.488240_3_plen_308_part_00